MAQSTLPNTQRMDFKDLGLEVKEIIDGDTNEILAGAGASAGGDILIREVVNATQLESGGSPVFVELFGGSVNSELFDSNAVYDLTDAQVLSGSVNFNPNTPGTYNLDITTDLSNRVGSRILSSELETNLANNRMGSTEMTARTTQYITAHQAGDVWGLLLATAPATGYSAGQIDIVLRFKARP